MGDTQLAEITESELDEWQKEVLASESKRIAIRAGRQCGKSTVVAQKVARYSLSNSRKVIVVIAAVERQAQLLFEKIFNTIATIDRKAIKGKPTKSYCRLKNDTQIWCLPTGQSGYGIRGFTVDLLIADEAHYIGEEVYTAIMPMLAVTKGTVILLSTPDSKKGTTGYFYDCFKDEEYKTWHVSSEDCARIPKEFLERQKKRMTKVQYSLEYLAAFIENIEKFFPTSLIQDSMNLSVFVHIPGKAYYLGLDFARYGGDENAFVIVEYEGDIVKCIVAEVTSMVSTAETIQRVLELDRQWNFRRIFLDDGGLGAPILDQFLVTTQVKRKVIGINNAKRSIDREDPPRQLTLMKEDLYNNLKALMEQKRIRIIKDDNLFQSLDCVRFEIKGTGESAKDATTGQLRTLIYGNYLHLTEALIRAAWCVRTKGLNIWVR